MAGPGFSPGGVPTPKIAIIFHIFAENCMKMKEFGPPGGARVPGTPLGSANAFTLPSLVPKNGHVESNALSKWKTVIAL